MVTSEPMALQPSSSSFMTTRSSTNKKLSLLSSVTSSSSSSISTLSPQQSSSLSSSLSLSNSTTTNFNLRQRKINRKSTNLLSSSHGQYTKNEIIQKTSHLSNTLTIDKIRMGTQVDAWKQDLGDYYRARIVDIEDTLVFIHFEGFGPEHADWIRLDDLRPPHDNNTKKQHGQYSSTTTKTLGKRRKKTSLRQIDDPKQHQRKNNNDDHDMTVSGKYGPKSQENPFSWQNYSTFYYTQQGMEARQHTGLVHDGRMALHCCPCHSKEFIHPERPERLSSILQQLHNDRLLRYVKHIRGREATSSELSKAHTIQHIRNYQKPQEESNNNNKVILTPSSINTATKTLHGIGGDSVTTATTTEGYLRRPVEKGDDENTLITNITPTTSVSNSPPDLVYEMVCDELGISVDTTFHPLYTSLSAKVAAGSLITLVDAIVQNQLKNGFALIRPPGHHAEDDTTMGYCFFNNVAVAALSTLDKYPTQIKKILIIDWDIHHGNGTQKIFYDNPNVLYISIHRWDHGEFYPHTGAPEECGVGEGLGKNVNIALSNDQNQSRPMGDPEFTAAFYHLIVPIATQFNPDMIFVSAGFDAAGGHPDNLGGYTVTSRGFSVLTKLVMDLAQNLCQGKLVLALEGGYALQPLAKSAAACINQLLQPNSDYHHTLNSIKPNEGCVISLAKCIQIQQSYWQFDQDILSPTYRFHLPEGWLASNSILTRPKREKTSMKIPMVEGY